MVKNPRNSMKISLVHFMAYPSTMGGGGPVLESIDELVADEFFDVLEITHIEDPEVRKAARHRVHTAGMELAFATQPLILGGKLNLHSRDAAARKTALDRILSALDEAAEMGAVGFAVMSGPDPGEAAREEERNLFIESLRSVCERAKSLNPEMAVVVETFDRVPFGKNCLVGPTDEAVPMAEAIRADYPRFGLMLDLSHLPLLNETSAEAIPKAAPVMLHAHVGNCVKSNPDNEYYGDNHPPFDYPDGENGLDELVDYLKCLHEAGYLNESHPPIVGIEAKPANEAMRPAVLGNVKRYMNRALRALEG